MNLSDLSPRTLLFKQELDALLAKYDVFINQDFDESVEFMNRLRRDSDDNDKTIWLELWGDYGFNRE